MEFFSLLLVAFLFGGMLLFSLGFGTLAFKFLELATARPVSYTHLTLPTILLV